MRRSSSSREERACGKVAAHANARARVSKDEDEPLHVPSCFETHRSAAGLRSMHAPLRCDAPQHEGDGGPGILAKRTQRSFWPNEPNISTRVVPARGTPRRSRRGGPLRGPMIMGRWSWIPALATLCRDDDQSGGVTDQPAAVGNDRRHGLPVSGLFFTGNRATPTCPVHRLGSSAVRETQHLAAQSVGSRFAAPKLRLAVEPAHAGHLAARGTNARDRRIDWLERDRHVESVGVKERCRVAHDRHVPMPKQEIAAPQV
jgi:hypothetical protein